MVYLLTLSRSIFSLQIRTGVVSCKAMTMVTPIHLMIFGCRKVEAVEGVVSGCLSTIAL